MWLCCAPPRARDMIRLKGGENVDTQALIAAINSVALEEHLKLEEEFKKAVSDPNDNGFNFASRISREIPLIVARVLSEALLRTARNEERE